MKKHQYHAIIYKTVGITPKPIVHQHCYNETHEECEDIGRDNTVDSPETTFVVKPITKQEYIDWAEKQLSIK